MQLRLLMTGLFAAALLSIASGCRNNCCEADAKSAPVNTGPTSADVAKLAQLCLAYQTHHDVYRQLEEQYDRAKASEANATEAYNEAKSSFETARDVALTSGNEEDQAQATKLQNEADAAFRALFAAQRQRILLAESFFKAVSNVNEASRAVEYHRDRYNPGASRHFGSDAAKKVERDYVLAMKSTSAQTDTLKQEYMSAYNAVIATPDSLSNAAYKAMEDATKRFNDQYVAYERYVSGVAKTKTDAEVLAARKLMNDLEEARKVHEEKCADYTRINEQWLATNRAYVKCLRAVLACEGR